MDGCTFPRFRVRRPRAPGARTAKRTLVAARRIAGRARQACHAQNAGHAQQAWRARAWHATARALHTEPRTQSD
eukprot:10085793-Lingulodinium_polyedra.AAC.1